MTAILADAVRALAFARATHAELADELRDKRAAFELEHRDLVTRAKAAAAAVDAADTSLRALTLAHYANTKEAKPCRGIEVKSRDTMSYDGRHALEWARETKLALKPESLDVKAFEKIAKATPLDFVTYESEPQIYVASDLSEVLASETLAGESAPADTAVAAATNEAPF